MQCRKPIQIDSCTGGLLRLLCMRRVVIVLTKMTWFPDPASPVQSPPACLCPPIIAAMSRQLDDCFAKVLEGRVTVIAAGELSRPSGEKRQHNKGESFMKTSFKTLPPSTASPPALRSATSRACPSGLVTSLRSMILLAQLAASGGVTSKGTSTPWHELVRAFLNVNATRRQFVRSTCVSASPPGTTGYMLGTA